MLFLWLIFFCTLLLFDNLAHTKPKNVSDEEHSQQLRSALPARVKICVVINESKIKQQCFQTKLPFTMMD